MFQTEAMWAFKGRALGSSPTRALLDKIKVHQMGLEATLAAITVLWWVPGWFKSDECEERPEEGCTKEYRGD